VLREYEGERARRDEREISFREREILSLSHTCAEMSLSLLHSASERRERLLSLSF